MCAHAYNYAEKVVQSIAFAFHSSGEKRRRGEHERERERERETERDRERQRETERDRDRDSQREMLGERRTASACIAFAEIQIFCRRVFYFGQGALRGSNLGDQGHLAIRQEDSLSLVAPGLSPRFVSRDGLAGTLEMKRADFRLKIKSHTVSIFAASQAFHIGRL